MTQIQLPTGVEQIEEDKPVAEGLYDLRIRSAEDAVAKNGKTFIKMMVEIEGHEEAAPIFDMIWIPDPQSEYYRSEAQKFNRWVSCWNVPIGPDGLDVAALLGLTASQVPVKLEWSDHFGADVNVIQYPRLG